MPVAFTKLSDDNLKELQEHYLPIMFNVDKDDIYQGFSRISKSDRQLDDPGSDLFVKYNIDLELYAKMRKYEMICDAYFKNYDRRYFLKKLNNQFGIFHITE